MKPKGSNVMAPRSSRAGVQQRGITMVEILVALIVLAIGFLGMASIQLLGAKNIAGSSYRTLATIYAYDMAERMRSNIEGVEGGFYNKLDGNNKMTNPKCVANCSPKQIAQRDGFDWNQLIQNSVSAGGLPDGVGSVSFKNDQHEIRVAWREYIRVSDNYGNGTGTPQEFVLQVKLEP